MAATPISIPGRSGIPIPGGPAISIPGVPGFKSHKKKNKGSQSEEDGYSSACSSPSSSPSSSERSCNTPPLGTSYFGKQSIMDGTPVKSASVVVNQSPPSPTTAKRLLRIRKMSDMCRNPQVTGNISTIPIQPKDINEAWAKLVINQHRIKHFQPPLPQTTVITRLNVNDCKKSSGDLSTTCRISVDLKPTKDTTSNYVFIAKLLPADDPCRVYVFESNVFEKEISIYFELLPCLRQFCEGTALENLMPDRVPSCIYGSNNCDGAGVLVFECAQERGFKHPSDPEGLSLDQVMTTIKFMAQFHAIGSALLITKGQLIKLRYPFLSSNVYSSPQMAEGAKNLFHIYTEFLKSVSESEADGLALKFTKYCNEDGAAREMFSCLRRQVDNPFNTIIHGELWEKNMLFHEASDPTTTEASDLTTTEASDLTTTTDKAAEGAKPEKLDGLRSIILDWKNAKIASATKDLAFFLLSSTSNNLREDCLEEILETYYSIFCKSLQILGVNTGDCQGLSFEEFRTDYAVSTKGAFLQSVCVLVQELTFMEAKLFITEPHHCATHIQNLGQYERRALELMYDRTLNQTHFV